MSRRNAFQLAALLALIGTLPPPQETNAVIDPIGPDPDPPPRPPRLPPMYMDETGRPFPPVTRAPVERMPPRPPAIVRPPAPRFPAAPPPNVYRLPEPPRPVPVEPRPRNPNPRREDIRASSKARKKRRGW